MNEPEPKPCRPKYGRVAVENFFVTSERTNARSVSLWLVILNGNQSGHNHEGIMEEPELDKQGGARRKSVRSWPACTAHYWKTGNTDRWLSALGNVPYGSNSNSGREYGSRSLTGAGNHRTNEVNSPRNLHRLTRFHLDLNFTNRRDCKGSVETVAFVYLSVVGIAYPNQYAEEPPNKPAS
jgi:hypothetical protein